MAETSLRRVNNSYIVDENGIGLTGRTHFGGMLFDAMVINFYFRLCCSLEQICLNAICLLQKSLLTQELEFAWTRIDLKAN